MTALLPVGLNFEVVTEALFNQLVGAVAITFTAAAMAGSATLLAPTSVANLLVGLGIFGTGVDEGTTIIAIDPGGASITLSGPMNADTVNGDTTFTTGFLTTGRRVKHSNDVPDQPALFLRRVGVTDQDEDPFTVTTLHFEAWIYSNAGADSDIAPDTILTGLEQLVRTSLLPNLYDEDGARQTLATALAALGYDPIYRCRIQGHSPVNPGDQGPQAKTVIPILVTLPGGTPHDHRRHRKHLVRRTDRHRPDRAEHRSL